MPLWAGFLALLWGTWAGAETQVRPPCLDSVEQETPRMDMRPCSSVLRQKSGSGPPGILDRVEANVRFRIQCFYKGVIPDFKAQQCSGTNYKNIGVATTVCSLADGEDKSNQLGEPCGEMKGAWESSQARGLRVQAWKYYRDQVVSEIEKQGTLHVSEACRSAAEDLRDNLYPQAKQISDGLVSGSASIPAATYLGGVDFCSPGNEIPPITLSDPQGNSRTVNLAKSIPKSSACYLSVGREHMEAIYGYLALCEVDARIFQFLAEYGDKEYQNAENIIRVCMDKATEKAQSIKDGEETFDKCYSERFRTFFQGVINKYVPGKLKSSNEMQGEKGYAGWVIFAGALSGKARRRKRHPIDPRTKRFIAKLLVFLGSNCVILAFSSFYIFGCGGSVRTPHIPTAKMPAENLSAYNIHVTCVGVGATSARIAQCCETSDNSKMKKFTKEADCLACEPEMCQGLAPHLESAAALAGNAEQAFASARKGISQAPPVALTAQAAPGFQFPIVPSQPLPASTPTKAPSPFSGNTTLVPDDPSLTNANAKPPLSQSMAVSSDTVSRAATAGGQAPVHKESQTQSQPGAEAWRSSGAVAPPPAGPGKTYVLSNTNRSDAPTGEVPPNEDEGMRSESAEEEGGDERDYFSRIPARESIFRVVERRYRKAFKSGRIELTQ